MQQLGMLQMLMQYKCLHLTQAKLCEVALSDSNIIPVNAIDLFDNIYDCILLMSDFTVITIATLPSTRICPGVMEVKPSKWDLPARLLSTSV